MRPPGDSWLFTNGRRIGRAWLISQYAPVEGIQCGNDAQEHRVFSWRLQTQRQLLVLAQRNEQDSSVGQPGDLVQVACRWNERR